MDDYELLSRISTDELRCFGEGCLEKIKLTPEQKQSYVLGRDLVFLCPECGGVNCLSHELPEDFPNYIPAIEPKKAYQNP